MLSMHPEYAAQRFYQNAGAYEQYSQAGAAGQGYPYSSRDYVRAAANQYSGGRAATDNLKMMDMYMQQPPNAHAMAAAAAAENAQQYQSMYQQSQQQTDSNGGGGSPGIVKYEHMGQMHGSMHSNSISPLNHMNN